MKKILTLAALLFVASSCFAQNDHSSYEDLMKRSRKARTTGIILVSTGPVVAVGGIGTLIYGLIQNEEDRGDYYFDQNGNYVPVSPKKHTTEIVVGAAAAVVGIGIALSSIAFTNKAYDLKREARKAKLRTSTDHINIPGLQSSLGTNRVTQYKLSLMMPLGR